MPALGPDVIVEALNLSTAGRRGATATAAGRAAAPGHRPAGVEETMMSRPELTDTLTALALGACRTTTHIAVEEAEISLPLVVRMERGLDGPRFYAQPPFSAFHSGFEPVVHRARLSLASVPTEDLAAPTQTDADTQPGPPGSRGVIKCPPAQAIR